jgi:DNA-binding IclR family transcriptional regulator
MIRTRPAAPKPTPSAAGSQARNAVSPAALARHRIPIIDRMVEILFILERDNLGASIRDIVDQLGLPRTSVYRILNTLQFHEIVRRSPDGTYRLGPRLLALAARAGGDHDIAAVSAPHLRRLATETGEGCKVSVVDGDGVVVVAVVDGKREYALTVVPGQRLPLHAGAAGKLLMAHLPALDLAERLHRPLPGYTPKTLADPRRLATELARVRKQGWAQDKGEYSPSVQAFAAAIEDESGKVVAALSVPFLTGATVAHMEAVRLATIRTAKAISTDLRHRADA